MPDLRALRGVGRREPQAAASEQNDRRRAVRDLGDERRAGGHLDGDVGAFDDEIADVVLPRRVERQAIQAGDVRDRLHPLDVPVGASALADGGRSSTRHVESLRFDAALDEDFDQHLLPVALEGHPVAFLDHDTRRIGARRRGELVERGRVGILDRQSQERRRGPALPAPVRGERPASRLRRAGSAAEPRTAVANDRHASATSRRRAMDGLILDPGRWEPGTSPGRQSGFGRGQQSGTVRNAISVRPGHAERLTARIVRSSAKRARRACAWTAARTSAPMAAGDLSA